MIWLWVALPLIFSAGFLFGAWWAGRPKDEPPTTDLWWGGRKGRWK